MKIKFLGTSHGVPEPNRHCTSVLVEAAGKYYLIDAGAPISDELINAEVAFADISAIFLTHMHGDHINGLVHFIDLSSWFYKDSDPLIYTPSLDLKTGIEAWMTMLRGDAGREFRYTEIVPGEIYADEAIRVTAIPTQHHVADREDFKRQSYSFAVTEVATGKRVLFTGDLRPDMCDMPEDAFTVGYDCIITEAAHGRLDKLAPRLAACKTKLMIISHRYSRTNPQEKVDVLRAALNEPLELAEDGQEFTI